MAHAPRIAAHVPLRELGQFAEALLIRGVPLTEADDEIAAVIDAIVDWPEIIPGPAGDVVEDLDGPIALQLARLIVRGAERRRQRRARKAA